MQGVQGVRAVKPRIVTVMSPKGGVGKTTITIMLAYALRGMGKRVGIADIDYHGPTLPVLLLGGFDNLPKIEVKEDKVKPVEIDGIKVFSLAFIADPEEVVMWSGETAQMYTRALLTDIDWGDVEYLVVDTPPGLWDSNVEILTMSDAVVVVTEPTLASVYDALKIARVARSRLAGIVVNEARPVAREIRERALRVVEGLGAPVFTVEFSEDIQINPRKPHPSIKKLSQLIVERMEG